MFPGRTFLFTVLFSVSLFAACHPSKNGEKSEKAHSNKTAGSIFTDVTDQKKLNFIHDPGVDGSYFMPESMGSGAAFLDYDNDGDLDIFLVNGTRHGDKNYDGPPLKDRLFRQESSGVFVDVTDVSGLNDTGYGMGVAAGDIDNDGDVDVYVTNFGPDSLYRNNGDGTFTNISKQAGIDNPEWSCSAIFVDYDLNGFLDIYVTTYVDFDARVICTDKAGRPDYCGPKSFNGVSDVLYHNNENGTFTDVSETSGIGKPKTKGLGVVAGDFNADHYPDIYVANDGEANHLWINRKNGTFQDLGLALGAAVNFLGQPEASMGVAAGDIDEDADLDLFMTHLRDEKDTLYRNMGTNGFQDDSWAAGVAGPSIPFTGFGTGFLDYDHDGDLDLAVVNGRVTRGALLTSNNPPGYWDPYAESNFLYFNDGKGKFSEVGDGCGSFCKLIANHRGLAFGDMDNDGDIDLLASVEGGKARLFRNDLKPKGHWLLIRAIDPALKRDAIGAKITVLIQGKQFLRLIGPGYSYLSSNDPRAHFGLGSAKTVDQIVVEWPDGTKEIFPGTAADQVIILRKGQAHSPNG